MTDYEQAVKALIEAKKSLSQQAQEFHKRAEFPRIETDLPDYGPGTIHSIWKQPTLFARILNWYGDGICGVDSRSQERNPMQVISLYTRWLLWGVRSPSLRKTSTTCTKKRARKKYSTYMAVWLHRNALHATGLPSWRLITCR